jgi:hypothetical protein
LRAATLLAGFVFSLEASAVVNNYEEPGFNPGRDYVSQHFAEHIDPLNGNLILQYTDVFIPGNGGLDIKVQRTYNVLSTVNWDNNAFSAFGRGWKIHFGRVVVENGTACTANSSLVMELPDGGQQPFYKTAVSGMDASSEFVSAGMWRAKCDSSTGGVVAWAPDGTRYDMTIYDGAGWLVSQITARDGCSSCNIKFTYRTFGAQAYGDPGRVVPETIKAWGSGSPQVTFLYTAAGLLSGINAQGRLWQYNVTSSVDGTRLNYVQPPAGPSWQYLYYPNSGMGPNAIQKVTYPTGATITYTYDQVNFLRVMGYQLSTVVKQKTTWPDSDTWTFDYNPSTGPGVYDVTTVTQPSGLPRLVYKHFGFNTVSAGSVWKVGLLFQESVEGAGIAELKEYTWTSALISNMYNVRPGYNKVDPNTQRPLLANLAVTRDGTTYNTAYAYPAGDAFGNPTSIAETGNWPGGKSRSLSYQNLISSSKWILGLVTSENTSNLGVISRTFDQNTGRMKYESRFGVETNLTYTLDGDVDTKRDALNRTTNYGTYKRGVPQSEIRGRGVGHTHGRRLGQRDPIQ